jgi:hypothetical protein
MKTTKFFIIAYLLLFGIFKSNSQATTASSTNTVTSTAYLGSGAASNFDVQFKRFNISSGLIATDKTYFGLNSLALANSVAFGVNAGQFSSGSGYNTYLGQNAGKGQSISVLNSGTNNTFTGYGSGTNNTTGSNNSFFGYKSGLANDFGQQNVYIGSFSGNANTEGSGNVYVGYAAGGSDYDGSNNVGIGTSTGSSSGQNNVFVGTLSGNGLDDGYDNTFIGARSGTDLLTGSKNILIGSDAGPNTGDAIIDNKLYVDNTGGNSPLIWGDFAADQLKFNGKVGIGGNSTTGFGSYPTTAGGVNVSTYQLFVKGGILTEEVRVSAAGTWADYVFNKDYNLKSLLEVEDFINENGHLPNVPSAAQIKEEGIALGEMSKIQQEKIEELTLYIIALNKKLEAQEKKINELTKGN